MSKIQDALKRIQSSSAPKLVREEETAVLGVLHSNAVPDDPENDTQQGNVVLIDREALRREGYLAEHGQERYLADQYRLIKRPLLANANNKGGSQADDANLIMVTSALPADGKTITCINLALSISREKDKSVLLVDADVAKPHVSALFGVEEQPGLIDILKSDHITAADVIIGTDVEGLSVLPAGPPDEHSTELLASRKMKRLLQDLSSRFPDRIVIFDSPPLLVTSEARVIADGVGQIALVVRAGKTPQQAVFDAIDGLDEDKAVNLILNESGSGSVVDGYGVYGGYGNVARDQ
jgi:protein-tyrosine kinase